MEENQTRIYLNFFVAYFFNFFFFFLRYTSYDHSNYFFKTKTSSLEEALDVFANMFISPTFDESIINKEVIVFENEY